MRGAIVCAIGEGAGRCSARCQRGSVAPVRDALLRAALVVRHTALRVERSPARGPALAVARPPRCMEGAAARVASTVVREAGRRVSKQALEVSEAAAARVAELLSQRDKPFLKLSVKTRGCSGLSYSMSYADEKGKFDELVTGPGGVKILVDNKALMHVVGTRMDFVNDRLKSEFVFQNPNSKGACGCGESFTT